MSDNEVNGGAASPHVDVTLTAETGVVNFTPYALARMSNDFFQAAEVYVSDVPPFNYFMRCASIELGFKSAIISTANSPATKALLKRVGHDLEKAHAEFVSRFPDQLTQAEVGAIKLISPYFKSKGLEYITLDVITQLAMGLAAFPDYALVRSASAKINSFLVAKNFFIDA